MPRYIEAYSYGCVMAMLPFDQAERLRAYANLIPDEALYDDGSSEHGREDSPHVTVKYGLHTDSGSEVMKVLVGAGGAKAKLGKMTAFENERYNVLKIDIDSPDLHRLNAVICENLEFTDNFPDYHPHLTVAYLNKDANWKKYASNLFEGTEVSFESLLFSSANDVETEIPLVQAKAARVASLGDRVARSTWEQLVGSKDLAGQLTSPRTQFMARVTLEHNGSEHDAQQAWLKRASDGAHDLQIIEGRVGSHGMREN